MVFMPFFPPPGQTEANNTPESVAFAHTMGNVFCDPRGTREAAPPRRTWKGRFQRALARVSKFFRRGRRSFRG
uniref:Uncharacterized protein n=1 Tax=Peromyscus maniculatus bairdii TaxID=230844 RepID=A0A8C8TPA4_PERMB